MRGRILVPVACLVLGGGLGFGASRGFRTHEAAPPPTEVAVAPAVGAATPDPGDELVVEIRVRAPGQKDPPRALAKGGSALVSGALVNTQNPLDLAVEGDGFFQAVTADGTLAYTRGGAFGVNAAGRLVTAEGHLLCPEFALPGDALAVAVGTDGVVSVQRPASVNASTVVGQLTLTRFPNPGWLATDEKGYARETPQAGTPTVGTPGSGPFGLVRQGFRERHAEDRTAALVELVRDLAREGDAGGARVRVLGGK